MCAQPLRTTLVYNKLYISFLAKRCYFLKVNHYLYINTEIKKQYIALLIDLIIINSFVIIYIFIIFAGDLIPEHNKLWLSGKIIL